MSATHQRSPVEVSDALLQAVADLVRAKTGLEATQSSAPRLRTAIQAALDDADDESTDHFLSLLTGDPERVMAIAAATTVAESYFFRENAQLEWLSRTAIPDLAALNESAPVRVWSAGCAGGEEPYSLAILLHESAWRARVSIVASDLSEQTLARARRAVYSPWSLRSTSRALTERWFTQGADGFELDRGVRESVQFVQHNLAGDAFPPHESGFGSVDVILCRNVLIYFDEPTVRRVVQGFLDALSPEGWLLLGACDPPVSGLVHCDVVETDAGVAHRRARPSSPPLASQPATPLASRPASPPHSARPAASPLAASSEETDSITRIRSLINVGDFGAASAAHDLAFRENPMSAELFCLAALIRMHEGRHADAAEMARRALYLDHTLIAAHVAFGVALRASGDHDGARRAAGNATRLLEAMHPDAVVPATDGERADVLLALVRAGFPLDETDDRAART